NFAAEYIYNQYKNMKTCGVLEEDKTSKKVLTVKINVGNFKKIKKKSKTYVNVIIIENTKI
ncbi:hypothetical protein, partial [uncultured Clostridium sp.]|uniref:hypothetical protein n=1 Tax=uncultured Clostridium sp. TaxID=59620 RepID=UPI00272E3A48